MNHAIKQPNAAPHPPLAALLRCRKPTVVSGARGTANMTCKKAGKGDAAAEQVGSGSKESKKDPRA